MDNKLNNARIHCLGGYVGIYNIELVNEKQQIWKGTIVIEPDSRIENPIIYFSREYHPDVNELDQIITEKHFEDINLIGVEFWLVPKEKLLFGYESPSTILKPQITQMKRPRIQM